MPLSRTGAEASPSRPLQRRRPSGEPPPLPRDLRRSGWVWGSLAGAVVAFWALVFVTGVRPSGDAVDGALLRRIVALRTPALTRVMRGVQVLGYDQTVIAAQAVAVAVALVFRRLRHVLVLAGCVVVTIWMSSTMAVVIARARPTGVRILGAWRGFAYPSRPMTALAVTVVAGIYMLVPHGRWRLRRGGTASDPPSTSPVTWVGAGILVLFGFARVYLGVDHPSDVLFGGVMGVGITLVAFRMLAPSDVFPITYRRGRSAHLDVSGRRGEAIRQALHEQLGLVAADVRPVGLEGSAGSTPVLIALAGDAAPLFGKVYAANHVRADRLYKLGRTLLYGRLEDEATFSTVRRLVQYEDYVLRLMAGAGLPTSKPYGFVEITPEREYLLVSEFFAGAEEISRVKIDQATVDDGLGIIRKLWVAGLAHRDIKPANVLVRDGRILVVDVAFAEVRPSPWRQAVDLANMMLVLALSSDADLVYERAAACFSADELSEAFAAAHGVAVPTELRNRLRADGRDILGRFRQLAPERPPIRIQHWSVRRLALTAFVLGGGVVGLVVAVNAFRILQVS